MALPPTPMFKFGFKIRTRSGLPVDNLVVHARDRAEAEGKIAQMYMHCEILECKEMQMPNRDESVQFEDIISLIARQTDDEKED
jgi:hypothetical protein